MGNNYANQFIFDKRTGRRERLIKKLSAGKLHGTRVAIDAMNYVHINMYGVNKKIVGSTNLFESKPDSGERFQAFQKKIIQQNMDLLESGITPVWVFDGKPSPYKLVSETRKAERELRAFNIEILEEKMHSLDIEEDSEVLKDELQKELLRETGLSSGEISAMKSMLYQLGIPFVEMIEGDGEQGCALLTKAGICSAVLTTDIDSLAYGAPVYLKTVESYGRKGTTVFGAVFRKDVLDLLQFTEEQFIEFFIMCGSDFNKSVPGIGGGRAYPLIKKYGNIDLIPSGKAPQAIPDDARKDLNVDICRMLFKPKSLKEAFGDQIDFSKDLNMSMPRFIQYGMVYLGSKAMDGHISVFHGHIEALPDPKEGPLKRDEDEFIVLEEVDEFFGTLVISEASSSSTVYATHQSVITIQNSEEYIEL